MKKLFTTLVCCMAAICSFAASNSDTLVYDIKDTAKDKTLLLLESAVQKNLAETAYKNMLQFQVISGVELVIIIILAIVVIRQRKRKTT